MTSIALLAAVSAAILLTSERVASQSQDLTLVPGASGKAVVNAVVDRIRSRCVFPEDRLFLRRAAAVVSQDGTDSSTYRQGYNGGIWQIDEAAFQSTLSCSGNIASACGTIQSEFNIDWKTVTWADLRKPLYSGLAATLVILNQLAGQDMPGDVDSQAQQWAKMYNDPNNGQKYSNQAAQATVATCDDKTDIVFVLDSSGSVSYPDFGLMLQFTANVVDLMGIATSDAVRVADVVYSNSVQVEFDFDDYLNNAAGLKNAILNTYKLNSGTATNLGLDEAASLLYDTSRGARSNAKKIAVLVTDGRSNNFAETVQSATKLKNMGATLFAIGVGGYNKNELDAVATKPICSYVLTLPNFAVITSILTEIQKSACEASFMLSNGTSSAGGEIGPGGSQSTTQTDSPSSPNKTIMASVNCGILDVYVSTTDPKPSSAVYEKKYNATDGSPAILSVVDSLPSGTPVYITVVGTRLPATLAALKNCTGYNWTIEVAEKPQVECIDSGVSRPCTEDDLTLAGLCTPVDLEPMDILFVLDSSGSLTYSDFGLVLKFTATAVDLMGVGTSEAVRVAEIVYGTSAKVEFDFDDYLSDTAAMKTAILNTVKMHNGSDTTKGLDEATSLLYDESRGARPKGKTKKVVVLVSDGRSNSFSGTVQSATKLKDKGATLIAIGVGKYNKIELDAVATKPTCSYVLTLPSFAVVTSIFTEFQESPCEASGISVGGQIGAAGTEMTTQGYPPSNPNKTIEASVKCGTLDIYVSTTDPKPSSTVYEEKYTATDDSPAVLSVVDSLPSGTPVYITVVGTRLPANLAAQKKCTTDYSWSLSVKDKLRAMCTDGNVSRPCTVEDLKLAGFCTSRATMVSLDALTSIKIDRGGPGHVKYLS